MNLLSTFVSTISALIIALIILYLDRKLTSIDHFNYGIKGLEYEIQANVQMLLELEPIIKNWLENLNNTTENAAITVYAPIKLLQNSYDFCRVQGILVDIPLEKQKKIDEIYKISTYINEFLKRDFEHCVLSSCNIEAIKINKKMYSEKLLQLIEIQKTISCEIDFKPHLKRFF
ncbi:MAG: hypothetical protein WC593_09325 [Methanoregula sp.]